MTKKLHPDYWRLRGWAMEAYKQGNQSKVDAIMKAADNLLRTKYLYLVWGW